MIEVYTDGSCHTQLKTGAWAAIVLHNSEKQVLSGVEYGTTHNRMELLAVIESIRYIKKHYPAEGEIHFVSDSQYVVGLMQRKHSIQAAQFISKKGNETRNADLLQAFYAYTENTMLSLEKIKAHQKQIGCANYNIDADKICRKLVREAVAKIT